MVEEGFLYSAVSLMGILASLLFSFCSICIICDQYLVACVDIAIVEYAVPEEIAGVTLIAIASAAPELILNLVSAFEDSSDVSTPAILGSAMIAFGFIPPMCVLCTVKSHIELKGWPLIRETLFYSIGLVIFLISIYNRIITLKESLLLTLVYFVYVFIVVIIYYSKWFKSGATATSVENTLPLSSMAGNGSNEFIPLLMDDNGDDNAYNETQVNNTSKAIDSVDSIDAGITDNKFKAVDSFNQCHSINMYMQKYITIPLKLLIKTIMPTLNTSTTTIKVSIKRVLVVVCFCISYISLLTIIIVSCCEALVKLINIDESTIGATLVAIGSEIPDTISSIALARNGYFDAAIAGAVGSQVINISLGVGLPAIILCLSNPTGTYQIGHEQSDTLWLLTLLLLIVICSYILITFPLNAMTACEFNMNSGTTFTRTGAKTLLLVWVTVYVIFILTNEGA